MLTLLSGDGGFQDLAGNDLAGGDFTSHFVVDIDESPYPASLDAKDPLGSLIYDLGEVGGSIREAGDTDTYKLDLDGRKNAARYARRHGMLRYPSPVAEARDKRMAS